MTLSDSQHAVVAWLASGGGPVHPDEPMPIRQGGWVLSTAGRDGLNADPETVDILKSRRFGHGELHAVTFSTRAGEPQMWICRTVDDGDGPLVVPIGGGGGTDPRRNSPWVNFAAQWGPGGFRGGGRVAGEGAERAKRVRLQFAGDTILEDDVAGGVVLFDVECEVTLPVRVDIFDASGGVLSTYLAFEEFA